MAELIFDETLVTDLRTSSGATMKLITVTGLSGNYTHGGIKLEPADFGFSEFHHVSSQTIYPIPFAYPGPWFAASYISVLCIDPGLMLETPVPTGTKEWRLQIYQLIDNSGPVIAELTNNTPLALPYGGFSMIIIGADA